MAGDQSADTLNITGWKKYYNTQTIIGRRNIALSTYAGLFLGFLYLKFRPKKSEHPVVGTSTPVPSDTMHHAQDKVAAGKKLSH